MVPFIWRTPSAFAEWLRFACEPRWHPQPSGCLSSTRRGSGLPVPVLGTASQKGNHRVYCLRGFFWSDSYESSANQRETGRFPMCGLLCGCVLNQVGGPRKWLVVLCGFHCKPSPKKTNPRQIHRFRAQGPKRPQEARLARVLRVEERRRPSSSSPPPSRSSERPTGMAP